MSDSPFHIAAFRELAAEPPRIFAFGDIHGCVVELQILLNHLVSEEKLTSDDLVVFIGDYIDRGPDSKGVVETLIQFRKTHPRTVCLRGNHEDMLLHTLGLGGRMGHAYLQNGGEQTLASYGVTDFSRIHADRGVSPRAAELQELIPESHLEFFRNLESYIITPRFVFCHAGLSPIRELRDQYEEDVFWIRDEFIFNIHHFDRMVVFGHTPYQDVLVHPPYKLGLDTGLVYGNMLSCVEVVHGTCSQVERGATKAHRGALATVPPLSRVP